MRIRPLAPRDHDRVGAITIAAYEASGTFVGADYAGQLRDVSARADAGRVFVAVDEDDRVLGSVVHALPGDAAWEDRAVPSGDASFRMLAVAPDAWGRGVGAALVDHCIALAREHGARRMVITSMPTMTSAHALYRGRGFVRRPDLDVRFPSGVGMIFQLDLVDDAAEHFPPPGPVPREPPWFEDVSVDDPHDASHC